MLATFEELLAEVEFNSEELTVCIEQSWVLPVKEDDGNYVFDEADVARVRLIAELRRDLGVNDEGIPVILRLLDQIYSLRSSLSNLHDAIKTLPEDARNQLEAELHKSTGR